MRNILPIISLILLSMGSHAQILKPIKWEFIAKKLKVGIYELHMTATLEKTWKIYSTNMGEGGPLPTSVHFDKNPNVLLGGKIKEIGALHKIHEEAFDMEVLYYTDKADFVQLLKLKETKKATVISGKIDFMVCDPNQCLPPEGVEFKVMLK